MPPRSWSGAGRHRRTGSDHPNAQGEPGHPPVSGGAPQHLHHLQRLRGHGHRRTGGNRGKARFAEQRVVVVSGDGGFLMNSQELETAVRLGLAITVLVLRDGKYGEIQHHMEPRLGRHFGVASAIPISLPTRRALACEPIGSEVPRSCCRPSMQALEATHRH
jgi:hypothetical protein